MLGLACIAASALTPLFSACALEDVASYAPSNDTYTARGIIAAVDLATLSSGISSRITEIPFKRGEAFGKGDTLIVFDCGLEKANLQAAKAQYEIAAKSLAKNEELLTFSATGKFDVDISRAEVDQARAEMDARQAIVSECRITAPFAGRVVALPVAQFESVQPVEPVIEIVGTGSFEVTLIASSDWLRWLSPDHEFLFEFDHGGQTVSGRVDRIGAVIDPVSQTLEIIGVIDGPTEHVRAGMSGIATFAPPIGG